MGTERQQWHRPVSISFPQTQKTLTKLREAAWLHSREASPWQGWVSALTFQHQLPLLPKASPNLSHSCEKALPLTPTALRLLLVLPHWLENTMLLQQQSYHSCHATHSLVRGC